MMPGVSGWMPASRRMLLSWLAFSVLAACLAAEPLEPERVATVIEALTRLGPEKVETNPKLKEALGKVLEATRGTPQFVELVRDFKIKNQDPALLEIAAKNPSNSTGLEAARLIVADSGHHRLLVSGLAGGPAETIGGPEPGLADGDFTSARFNARNGYGRRAAAVSQHAGGWAVVICQYTPVGYLSPAESE